MTLRFNYIRDKQGFYWQLNWNDNRSYHNNRNSQMKHILVYGIGKVWTKIQWPWHSIMQQSIRYTLITKRRPHTFPDDKHCNLIILGIFESTRHSSSLTQISSKQPYLKANTFRSQYCTCFWKRYAMRNQKTVGGRPFTRLHSIYQVTYKDLNPMGVYSRRWDGTKQANPGSNISHKP